MEYWHNWEEYLIPPSVVNLSDITIDPISGTATLDLPLDLQPGSSLRVKTGKTLILSQ